MVKTETTNPERDMSKQATRARHFAPNSYLNRFFAEKQIETVDFAVVNRDGVTHWMDTEVVIEHIALTRGAERTQVEGIIRKIDFHNGDLNHFFEHLAEAIANR